MNPQFFYTFDHDAVIEFEGALDPLYGTVEASGDDKGSHRLPRQMFVLGRDAWHCKSEAVAALKKSCTRELLRAIRRYESAAKTYKGFCEAKDLL